MWRLATFTPQLLRRLGRSSVVMLVAALVLALGSGAAFADPKPPGKAGETQQPRETSSDWLRVSPWEAIISKVCEFAGRAAMECDNDGTASDFVPDPDAARPVEGIVESMESVGDKLGGGVTMVSGRPTDYLHEHYPNQNVDGGYGMVRLRDGQVEMHPEIAAAQEPLEQAVQRIQNDPEIQASGAFVELKRDANNTVWTGVAVHTRRPADAAGRQAAKDAGFSDDVIDAAIAGDTSVDQAVRDEATGVYQKGFDDYVEKWGDRLGELTKQIGDELGLKAVPGNQVMELKPNLTDPATKREAVLRIADETGAELIIAAGDDKGDLPAAQALKELREQGKETVLIVVRQKGTPQELLDQADVVLDSPAELARFMDELDKALPGTKAVVLGDGDGSPPAPEGKTSEPQEGTESGETTSQEASDASAEGRAGANTNAKESGDSTEPTSSLDAAIAESRALLPGGDAGTTDDGQGDNKDAGGTKAAERPGGTAFGGDWRTQVAQLGLGKPDQGGDEGGDQGVVIGTPEQPQPGGIVVGGGGVAGGEPGSVGGDAPAPEAPGIVVVPSIGGTVTIQTGAANKFSAPGLDLGAQPEIFPEQPDFELQEVFGPPAELPSSTITDVGDDVGLGAGAGTSIFTPPIDLPVDTGPGRPGPPDDLIPPDRSALLG